MVTVAAMSLIVVAGGLAVIELMAGERWQDWQPIKVVTPHSLAMLRGVLFLGGVGLRNYQSALVIAVLGLVVARFGLVTVGVVRPALRSDLDSVGLVDEYHSRWRWADPTSRPAARLGVRARRIWLMADVALAYWLAVDGDWLVVALLVVTVGLGLWHDLAVVVRWPQTMASYQQQLATALASLAPAAVLYSAASPRSVGNLAQWLPSLESSDLPSFMLVRERGSMESLQHQTKLPIVYVKALAELEPTLPDSLTTCLYVDTSVRNNHLLRLGSLNHVQLHHGDSNKASSISPMLKMYGHHFVAGQAAIDRLKKAGVIVSDTDTTVVGRPIAACLAEHEMNTKVAEVAYAPTWEGYHRDNAVSSLSNGPALVAVLLERHDVAVTFRPHPLAGSLDKTLRRPVKEIRQMIARAGPPHRVADEEGPEAAIAMMSRLSVLVSDRSSLISDFFYCQRPVLMINTRDISHEGLVAAAPELRGVYIVAPDLSNLDECLSDALGADPLAAVREEAAHYVLGDLSGGVVDFGEAIERLPKL